MFISISWVHVFFVQHQMVKEKINLKKINEVAPSSECDYN